MDNKIRMPSSGGGIVRYFDDYRSKLEFKPIAVIIMIVIVIILEVVLHMVG